VAVAKERICSLRACRIYDYAPQQNAAPLLRSVCNALLRPYVMLGDQDWAPASIHQVVAAILQAERDRFAPLLPTELQSLVDQPKLDNPRENHSRLRLLYVRRIHLMAEVPPDTDWHEVRFLRNEHLSELHVIARCGFMPEGHPTALLTSPSHRTPELLRTPPAEWKPLVLWGHSPSGPFTILEGNHRLAAFVGNGASETLQLPVFVGLSNTPSHWHSLDQPGILANDLFAK
jgi:hypothetical protein